MLLIKYDTCMKRMNVWYDEKKSAAEPIFAPNPSSDVEDDTCPEF